MKFTLAISHNGLLKKLPNTNLFEVRESFEWYIDYNNKKGKIIVPVGLKTDFWSIPRFLWIFLNPTKYISFILHDYLYKTWLYTRKQSDIILLEALTVEWASKLERIFIYIWVRVFWWIFYKHFFKSVKDTKF